MRVFQGTVLLKAGSSTFKSPEVGVHRVLEENRGGGLGWFQDEGRCGDGKGGGHHRGTQVISSWCVVGVLTSPGGARDYPPHLSFPTSAYGPEEAGVAQGA